VDIVYLLLLAALWIASCGLVWVVDRGLGP
jgi:hypothetical protein